MWASLVAVWHFITSNGLVVPPLILLSLIALAISIERFWYLRRSHVMPVDFLNQIDEYLSSNRISEAMVACKTNNSPIARILFSGLKISDHPAQDIRLALESAGKTEAANLERRIHFLHTVVGVSPLFGLFGTVAGMIRTFSAIKTQGLGVTEQLAGGIGEALVSTAAGLSVAIPFFLLARYFGARVDTYTRQMEDLSERLWFQLTRANVKSA